MRCSASSMFASDNVNSCTCVICKSIFSLMTRIDTSLNLIVKSIVGGDVYCMSALRNVWISLVYIIWLLVYLAQQHHAFVWTHCTCTVFLT